MSIYCRKLVNCLPKTTATTVINRKVHLVNRKGFENRYQEIKIPVPWGHLAGKLWGPTNQRPILCIHGWQESCGSFDPLFKLLPPNLSLLAIDFPGHGLSSRLPKGVFYHGIDGSILIRRIQKYFGWPTLSLLGHSMGAIMSFMYTTLFPKDVDLLICIDALKPFSKFPGTAIKNTLENIDEFLKYEQLNDVETSPPSYTIQEMIDRIHKKTRKSIAKNSCEFVLERIIEQIEPNRYIFSRDNRLKVGPLVGMQHSDILEYAKRVKCPHIMMKATQSTYYENKEYFYDVINILKENNNDFYYKYVEGTHHVHVNNPELVLVHIKEFLDKYNTFDRSGFSINQELLVN